MYFKVEVEDKELLLEEFIEQNYQARHINIEKYINGSLQTWYISGGNCGSIASAICMRYYYDYVSSTYVDSSKIGQNDLISLMQSYVGSGGTTYSNMVKGINSYLAVRSVTNSVQRTSSFSFSTVKNQINSSRPIIVGTLNRGTFGDHWIIAHGYFESPVDGNYIIVNNGWSNNNVWIEPDTQTLDGTIISANSIRSMI